VASGRNALTSIERALDIAVWLPTPRYTLDTDIGTTGPKISDTLFDNPEVFLDASDGTTPQVYTAPSGNEILTVIDQSGIFEIETLFCICSKEDNKDQQLLQSGLFPATFKSIKTVFTCSVLDDFLKDNLECKTTAQQYYAKLQSMTSKMFLDLVLVHCT
jgi:hypothetical protein